MSEQAFNVLFLCTGNSARSILAEAILNRVGRGKFRAFSAGSDPKGEVHPYTIQLLENLNHDTSFARSKSWDEFARPDAPKMDFVSRYATTPPTKPVRCGPDNRFRHIGVFLILQRPKERMRKGTWRSRKPTACSTTASRSSPRFP